MSTAAVSAKSLSRNINGVQRSSIGGLLCCCSTQKQPRQQQKPATAAKVPKSSLLGEHTELLTRSTILLCWFGCKPFAFSLALSSSSSSPLARPSVVCTVGGGRGRALARARATLGRLAWPKSVCVGQFSTPDSIFPRRIQCYSKVFA